MCSFGNASATIDQHSRRRVVYKVGSSKGQRDRAVKFSLLLYLANWFKILYDKTQIKFTATIIGLYKIFVTIRILVKRANTIYRNWFDGILGATQTCFILMMSFLTSHKAHTFMSISWECS